MGLDALLLVDGFIYFHTWCMQTDKVLARLWRCEDSSEPRVFAIMQYVPKSYMLAHMYMFGKIMISIFALQQ